MHTFSNRPDLDPTKTPTAIDIAWAAGVYEGEGHCRNRSKNGFLVQVVQKDTEILVRLRDWFGGTISVCSAKSRPPERTVHAWQLCGNRARFFIARIYPMLSSRRKVQVDDTRALQFLNGQSGADMPAKELNEKLKELTASRLSTDPRLIARRERERSAPWNKKFKRSGIESVVSERIM